MFKGLLLNMGWFYLAFGAFIIVGAANAVNFTDGLDGLATVPVMIAAAAFGLITYLVGNYVFAKYLQLHFVPGVGEVGVFCGAMIGAALLFRSVKEKRRYPKTKMAASRGNWGAV